MTGSPALSGLGTDLEPPRPHGTYTFGVQCKYPLTLVEVHGISGEVVVRDDRYRIEALQLKPGRPVFYSCKLYFESNEPV